MAELSEARNELEMKVAERTSDLRRSEAYLAEAQRLSHTGSFGWSVLSGEIYWSEETYNIFEHDRAVKPTLELVLQRIHPDDRDRVQQALDHATNEKTDFDIEHRLLMADGSVKHVHVLARALETSSGNLEYVGAVTDVTAARQAEQTLREGEAYLAEAQRLSHTGSWALIPATDEIRYWSGEVYRLLGFDPHVRKKAEQRLQNENVALREEIDRSSMFEEIVGISPALHAVLSRVSKVAPTDSTVLITGETGTGKELIARAVHRRSQRCSRAFVSVNCAAVPRDLIASELFGHEKGAFTGATQRRLGRFELAEGGTIFLDEVGELPAETQIALLNTWCSELSKLE